MEKIRGFKRGWPQLETVANQGQTVARPEQTETMSSRFRRSQLSSYHARSVKRSAR